MPNQQHNKTKAAAVKSKEESSGNWVLPAVLGTAIGAAATYFLTRPQETSPNSQQRCRTGASNCSTSNGSNFEAAPRGCCSICRDDYDATITMSCGHILHKDCYEQMKLHAPHGIVQCPMCRKRVE